MSSSGSSGAAAVTTIVDVDVEVGGEGEGERRDVRLVGSIIEAVDSSLPRTGTRVIDGAGGTLLPGLHDHHLHLLALAAIRRSVDLSDVAGPDGFDGALRTAHRDRPTGWLRIVQADERHGALDAERLERLAPGRPVRVQHRTGAAWLLSASATRGTGFQPGTWLHRADDALRAIWDDDLPDLATTSRELAAWGVTGVTDATPFADLSGFEALAAARRRGDVVQHTVVMGGPALTTTAVPDPLTPGPVKLVLDDHLLPDPRELAAHFAAAHRAGRAVAVHCVTRVSLLVALVAWDEAGSRPGDRIEHGSVIPVELLPRIAELGLQVVTQPGFVRARGDAYLRRVEEDDQPHLYRCGSLLDAGIGVAMSTDAPYGPADPWLAVAVAADRRTASGVVLGPDERVTPRRALDGFLSNPEHPAGPPRRVVAGGPADLCLLDRPLDAALDPPDAKHVVATWIAGVLVHGDPGSQRI